MIAYKAFKPDLTCRGYQFKENELNTTDEANCAKNGFHCAEDPLDCLTYYELDGSLIYEVEATGDIDEDDRDSKISCTTLILRRRLDLLEFVKAAARYILLHPYRKQNHLVHNDTAIGTENDKFLIVRGKNPRASGKKGTLICFLKENPFCKEILWYVIFTVDGTKILPDVPYNEYGEIVTEAECEVANEA